MTNILIVSHGPMAKGMLKSAEMIAGKQDKGVATVCLAQDQSPEYLKEIIEGYLNKWADTETLVLTDLISGTPYNVVGSLMSVYDFRHISGVNLGLLLEALLLRDSSNAKEMSNHLINVFPETVTDVNALLKAEE
jgi:PTS system mannose-specific IIA component